MEAVLADPNSELAAIIAEHGGDAHAVEMEGYGAAFAADHARTPIMVVRGISDMTQDKTPEHDAVHQPLAAIFAAAFSFELLNLWGLANPRPRTAVVPGPGKPTLLTTPAPAMPPRPSTKSLSTASDDRQRVQEAAPAEVDDEIAAQRAEVTRPTPVATAQAVGHGTDGVSGRYVYVLNFEGHADEFPPERVNAIAEAVSREIGAPVRVLKSEPGSFRLFLLCDRRLDPLRIEALRATLAEAHDAELLGAVSEEDYRALRDLEAELQAPSQSLLAWPNRLPDGRRMDRPELDQLLRVVSESTSSTTVVLGLPGSGKSALLATFCTAATDRGWPLLAIKADLLPPEIQSEEDLQAHLGLSSLPSRIIERLAVFQPVLLVIDQLDALAGYLDLRTGRLSVLLNMVRRLGRRRNVHIVLSARTFEFNHDVRLRSVSAESIELQLPTWAEVMEVLQANGVKAEGWPLDAQDVMRRPQALATFLRMKDRWGDQPFVTYQAMLDRLWKERILSRPDGSQLAKLVSNIAQTMAEEESLWLASARFEEQAAEVEALQALEILTTSENESSIGFTHQTLFDHALARSFARDKGRLSAYVLGRVESLFIRPKLWAGLTYLREVERPTYEKELETIWSSPKLRRHLKMLLIDFMGQQQSPTDREALLMVEALTDPEYRQLAFRAIGGSRGWFERTSQTFVAQAMTADETSAHPAAGVLAAAWEFASDEVAALIREKWLPNPTYDALTWKVLTNCTTWIDQVVDFAERIVSRTDISRWDVNHVVSTLGVDRPDAAIRLVRAKLDRELRLAMEESARRRSLVPPKAEDERIAWHISNSPESPFTELIDRSREWETLGSLAERAPWVTLQGLWPWFLEVVEALRTLEELRNGGFGYALKHRLDYRFEGEHSLDLDEPSILGALRVAAETLAAEDPETFTAWMAENEGRDTEPVHRLIAHAMASQPERYASRALQYLLADERRLYLGSLEDYISTTRRLVCTVSPYWSYGDLVTFINGVLAFAPKRPEHLTEAKSRRWFGRHIRKIRLGLLRSLPQDRVGDDIRRMIEEEIRALGDDKIGATFSGVKAIGSRMSRQAFAHASDAQIIHAFEELPDATGWDHPRMSMEGGNVQLSREFAEFAKEHPERADRLIRQFEPRFGQRAAGYALDAMAELADPGLITDLFLDLVARGFDSEEFRSSAAWAINRLIRRDHKVSDAILEVLERWLETPGVAETDDGPRDDEDLEPVFKHTEKDEETRSVLWEYGGFSALPAGNYPILETITQILLHRPDHDRLGLLLTDHVKRPEDPKVWQSLLRFLIYLRPSDEQLRARLLREIFNRYPSVLKSREAAKILANAHWWAPELVQEVLSSWRCASDPWLRQAYGELIVIVAIFQPELAWAVEGLDNLIADGDVDATLGAAFSAVNVWNEDKRRQTTDVLVKLIPRADMRTWHAILDFFRLVDELTPDPDTVRLLRVMAEHLHNARGAHATFFVERLQTLLPHEAQLVARMAQQLISTWRDELGDIRTATSSSADGLVDLAVTLHRLGPETRAAGTRLFEDLLYIDAWTARSTLDELDSRFRPGRAPVRPRLSRRKGRRRRRQTA